jgi:hypothetical protein
MADKNFNVRFDGVLDLDSWTILESDKNGERLYKLAEVLLYFNGKNVKLTIAEKDMIAPSEEE